MSGRALVLGGGGVTGVAWELGLLAGLAERGIDLAAADLIVGTSAGSVAGADLRSGVSPAELYQGQLVPPDGEAASRIGLGWIARLTWYMTTSRDPARARVRIGRMALAARTMSEQERRKAFEALPSHEWPAGRLLVTAVDAETGEFTAFDAASGAGLVDAVGASCAVPGIWPPVSIGGRRYMDGGMRSPANADLADGHGQVVVIAPLVRGFGHMTSVAAQVAGLSGSPRVVVVQPGKAARQAIGRNVLDPAKRAAAARAGYAQAADEAAGITAVWSAGPGGGSGPADRPGTAGRPA